MIAKTLTIFCDHNGCLALFEGDNGESRALVVIKQARAQGWVASDGRQYCHEHGEDADWWLTNEDEALHLIDAIQDARAVGDAQ